MSGLGRVWMHIRCHYRNRVWFLRLLYCCQNPTPVLSTGKEVLYYYNNILNCLTITVVRLPPPRFSLGRKPSPSLLLCVPGSDNNTHRSVTQPLKMSVTIRFQRDYYILIFILLCYFVSDKTSTPILKFCALVHTRYTYIILLCWDISYLCGFSFVLYYIEKM